MSILHASLTNGNGLVGYLTAGDGGISQTLDAVNALIAGGCTSIELGLPYSDPVADGPIIAASHHRSLPYIKNIKDYFSLVTAIKEKHDIPIICFSYFNPLLQVGTSFFQQFKQSGGDAVLVVDCPLDQLGSFYSACISAKVDPVGLVAPTTPKARISKIAKLSRGMLYVIADIGLTGTRESQNPLLGMHLAEIRELSPCPIVCGFGISKPEHLRFINEHAHAGVVGSYFVDFLSTEFSYMELKNRVKSLRYPLR